ncbi:MAG: hypothetical protein M5U28_16105 [Sandaracinaceae bacterium]|nr:hypothetical protein [Sandaracinaceae bacterium]
MPRLVPECFAEIYFNPALAYRCLLALEQDDGVDAVPAEYWTCYFVFTSHAPLEPACVPGACPPGMECGVRRNCVGCLPRCEPSLPEGAPCELVMPPLPGHVWSRAAVRSHTCRAYLHPSSRERRGLQRGGAVRTGVPSAWRAGARGPEPGGLAL